MVDSRCCRWGSIPPICFRSCCAAAYIAGSSPDPFPPFYCLVSRRTALAEHGKCEPMHQKTALPKSRARLVSRQNSNRVSVRCPDPELGMWAGAPHFSDALRRIACITNFGGEFTHNAEPGAKTSYLKEKEGVAQGSSSLTQGNRGRHPRLMIRRAIDPQKKTMAKQIHFAIRRSLPI